MRKFLLSGAMLAGFAAPVWSQDFTTAAEVRPILDATKGNWVAVREYDGKDLLYFTHLLAWRCGLDGIYFSLNGGAEQKFDAEPCYEGENPPNAIKATDRLPFLNFELKSVNTVAMRLVYDDGSEDTASFERAAIQIQ